MAKVQHPNQWNPNPGTVLLKFFRGNPEPAIVDITGLCTEINLYEDIRTPYLTGTVHVIDSANVLSMNVGGTEECEITVSNGEYPVTKNFVVWQVTDHTRSEDGNTVQYVLHLMEVQGYKNNFTYVSRAYNNNHTEIIRSIFSNYLDTIIEDNEQAFQKSSLIVPNMRPLEAVHWVLGNTTTSDGHPFFVYSTLKEGVQLRSLNTLYDTDNHLPFRFYMLPEARFDFDINSRQILTHTPASNERLVEAGRAGLFNSEHYIIDPYSGTIRPYTYNHSDEQRKALGAEKLPYDKDYSTLQSAKMYMSSVSTSGSFGIDAGINEESDITDHKKTLNAMADKFFMNYQSSNIVINGYHMLAYDTNTSIGRVIDINIPKPSPLVTSSEASDVADEKYSGKFLVTNVRHKFNIPQNNYVAALTCKRTLSVGDDAPVQG